MLVFADFSAGAGQIASDGVASQQAIAAAMDKLWQDVIGSGGGLWTAIVDLALFFAVGTLALFMVQWAQAFVNDDDPRAFSEIVWPLVVVVLLTNNGLLLGQGVLGLRSIANTASEKLLSSTSDAISLEEAYKQVAGDMAAETMARTMLSQCASEIDAAKAQACRQAAVTEAQSAADRISSRPKNGFENFISKVTGSDFSFGSFFQTNILQIAVRGWLLAFGTAFQWLVEISWVLTGLLAPSAVGGTLFPIGTKAILTWAVGFYSVAMVKICFNIIVGLVSTIVLKSGSADPMVFAFAVGLLAPVLSLALAGGGGMAILRGISSVGSSLVSRKWT